MSTIECITLRGETKLVSKEDLVLRPAAYPAYALIAKPKPVGAPSTRASSTAVGVIICATNQSPSVGEDQGVLHKVNLVPADTPPREPLAAILRPQSRHKHYGGERSSPSGKVSVAAKRTPSARGLSKSRRS